MTKYLDYKNKLLVEPIKVKETVKILKEVPRAAADWVQQQKNYNFKEVMYTIGGLNKGYYIKFLVNLPCNDIKNKEEYTIINIT